MSASPHGLAVGEVLAGRYKLVQEIGRGGFGVVYRATQLGMNRDVAVKLLHTSGAAAADPQMRERFRREAMMARNLNHPHTIRQYDFGETDDGMMYLVLEFLEGKNLVETLREEGALGDERVRRMAAGVLKSLAEAHAQGIVHRDLKPANIMLCNVYGERDYVKVLDFGIAKTVMGDTDLTAAGVALGSPRYMAPELLRGDNPTPSTDVYAIAITFAEAIMAKPLIAAENSVEAAQLQLNPAPLPIPDVLKQSTLWPWLSIALKKSEAERYDNAEEMLGFLGASPAKLADRGAEFHTPDDPTTQTPQIGEETSVRHVDSDVATQPREQPDLRSTQEDDAPSAAIQPPPEDDEEAATMRIDSADVDAFLQAREQQGAGNAATEEPRDDEAPTGRNMPPADDFSATNPSRDSFRPLNVQNRGLGTVDAEDDRMTTPLQGMPVKKPLSEDATQMVTMEAAEGAAPNVMPRVGSRDMATTSRDQPSLAESEGKTEMVSLEEALRRPDDEGEQKTEMVTLEEAFSRAEPPEQKTEMVSLEEAMRRPADGDAKTEMVNASELLEQYRTEGTHRPGMGTGPVGGPQISGQAFAQNATPGDHATSFIPVVTGHQSDQVQEKRKKYLVALAVLVFAAVLGIGGFAFAVYKLTKSPTADIPDKPTVTVPTPVVTPTVASTEFRVFTDPEKAAIVIDGTEKGRTPAKFPVPAARLPLKVTISLEGYESREITLKATGSTTFDLKLEKVPEAAPVEPEETKEPDKPKPRKPRKPRKPKPKPKPEPVGIPLFD